MNRMGTLAIAATLAALSACGGGATNEAGNEAGNGAGDNVAEAPANEAATDNGTKTDGNETAAAPAGDGTLSTAYMVGRWSDSGDCADVTEFRADGTFLFPWGDTGQWTLNGDQLTLTGNTSPHRIRVIDQNTLERTTGSGSTTRVTRC